MSDDLELIEKQLEELDEKSEQCFQKCQIRTAIQIAKEATHLAKTHSLAIHYMRGLFDQMRFGHGLLNPQAMREVSVELVLMLEDEEQARQIQPNLDEGHYHWLCAWMSTCAYDNLAEATGMMAGCNSAGMHECINDGLQICRQTGKLECIKCFREYAADVYLAADDFDMVRHQCQQFLEYQKEGLGNKDRRWSGHHKLAKLQILEGRLEQAISELNRALEFSQAEDVYLKLRSKAMVAVTLDEAQLLEGLPRFDWSRLDRELPQKGEWPYLDLLRTATNALELVIKQEYPAAIELLTQLDRQLTEQNCRKEWFEIRLRLIAAYLLSGNRKRAENLAKGLEANADEAQDFLTLRRLNRLLEAGENISSIAALHVPIDSSRNDSQDADSILSVEATEEISEEENKTPLAGVLTDYMQRIMRVQNDDDAREELLSDFFQYEAQAIESAHDAAYLVHLVQFIVRGTDDALRVWPWAQSLAVRFVEDPIVVSVVASLGHYFKTADPATFEFITTEQLESWFRLSTDPKVEHAKNFARAGAYYLDAGNIGEAERTYSRAFRLDRKDSSIVIPLADLYRQSERLRDGLAVLDLSLREGNDDQSVAWEAALTAIQLEQFDDVLIYINKYLELGEADTWAHYYKALADMQLGQYEESLAELVLEQEFNPPGLFQIQVLETCNLISLQRNDEAESVFEKILATPLLSVDYLTQSQLIRMLGQLWTTTTTTWPMDHPLRIKLEHLMLCAGLSTDEYFDEIRSQVETEETVFHYQVQTHQPLDESWPESLGCLAGQSSWTDYEGEWGVLAKTEEQAINLVLEYQSRCGNLPAEIVDVQTDEQEYRDRPGVVWQGIHWSNGDHDDDSEEMDYDLDDE